MNQFINEHPIITLLLVIVILGALGDIVRMLVVDRARKRARREDL